MLIGQLWELKKVCLIDLAHRYSSKYIFVRLWSRIHKRENWVFQRLNTCQITKLLNNKIQKMMSVCNKGPGKSVLIVFVWGSKFSKMKFSHGDLIFAKSQPSKTSLRRFNLGLDQQFICSIARITSALLSALWQQKCTCLLIMEKLLNIIFLVTVILFLITWQSWPSERFCS